MKKFFAVIGGMGTLATESYIRLVDEQTHAHEDQEFLDYVVFNDSSVPDRTEFILGNSTDSPLPPMAEDIKKATAIGASFITLPCNTAHYFFDELQALTDVPIIHMPKVTIEEMRKAYPPSTHPRVGFMGTRGSLVSGIYSTAITEAGYEFVQPDEQTQQQISYLIYHDVKETGDLNKQRYVAALEAMLTGHHCDIVILGCTELSVLNEAFALPELPIVDAQEVLARETVRQAKRLRED